jgi:sec-independent protein translocase protein TatA
MIGDLFDSPWKIAIIAILIIVLFGSRKLPGAARSLGQSMRILKKEISGLHEEDEPGAPGAPATAADATPAAAPAQLQAAPAAPGAPGAPAAASAAPDAQAQIAALQEQLNNIQQTVGANGTTATDSQQTR